MEQSKRKSRYAYAIKNSEAVAGFDGSRRKELQETIISLFGVVEDTYPYAYSGLERHKYAEMSKTDCRFHYLHCIKSYEASFGMLRNEFVEALWKVLYANFYSVHQDNMEILRTHILYILTPDSSKNESEMDVFKMLYKNFYPTDSYS